MSGGNDDADLSVIGSCGVISGADSGRVTITKVFHRP
jgi:hypothetical protein